MKIPFSEIDYGFMYGGAVIERVTSDDKKGWVVIRLKTNKRNLQLYITKTGKIRIFDETTGEIDLSKGSKKR